MGVNTEFEMLFLEVVVNGVEVHSKLKTMAFPDYEATAQVKQMPQNLENKSEILKIYKKTQNLILPQVVAKVAAGGEVEQVTVHQESESWCTIL